MVWYSTWKYAKQLFLRGSPRPVPGDPISHPSHHCGRYCPHQGPCRIPRAVQVARIAISKALRLHVAGFLLYDTNYGTV